MQANDTVTWDACPRLIVAHSDANTSIKGRIIPRENVLPSDLKVARFGFWNPSPSATNLITNTSHQKLATERE